MFHTIIFSAYIIPNIYVFLRIRNLFINRGYRIHFTLIYILLALIYPAGNFFSRRDPGYIAQVFNSIGNYILPFYLYLFLFVLVFDLFLLVNFMVKIIPSETLKSTKIKFLLLSVIIFLSLGVVVGGIINFNTIRISEYKIEIPRKASKIKNLKIAFAADFHLEEETSLNFVKKFAERILWIQPDILLLGGDLVEGDRKGENMSSMEKILAGTKTRYGVFGVPGNHEHYAGQEKAGFFDKAGIEILSDTSILIDSSFNLTGRNDSHLSSRESLAELMKKVNDSLPVILLDHRPTEIEQVSKTDVDIQLSGHTHHGQLFPINLIVKKIYDLSWGYRKVNNTHFFVTSGIRLWGPPVRTIGKSEIMVIDISFIP